MKLLRSVKDSVYNAAADSFEATKRDVEFRDPASKDFGPAGQYLWRNDYAYAMAMGRTTGTHVYLNSKLQPGDLAVTAAHEAHYHMKDGNVFHGDKQRFDYELYGRLGPDLSRTARLWKRELEVSRPRFGPPLF